MGIAILDILCGILFMFLYIFPMEHKGRTTHICERCLKPFQGSRYATKYGWCDFDCANEIAEESEDELDSNYG